MRQPWQAYLPHSQGRRNPTGTGNFNNQLPEQPREFFSLNEKGTTSILKQGGHTPFQASSSQVFCQGINARAGETGSWKFGSNRSDTKAASLIQAFGDGALDASVVFPTAEKDYKL
jgi:hypothetical protein